jgi:hypothetical protein
MSTKVIPIKSNGGEESWNFGEGSETSNIRQRTRSRRKTNDSELMVSHHRQADYPIDLLLKLPIAGEQVVVSHPHGAANGACNVSLFVLFKKLRNIDPKSCSANLSMILSVRWCCPDLAGYRIQDVNDLWTPKIAVLNKDNMELKPDPPWFYPLTGDVRQIIHCEGTVANKSDLATFPFDYETVSIQIAAEIGTGDRYVRLRWQDDTTARRRENSLNDNQFPPRTASSVTPNYVGELHMEWELLKGGNKIKRMKKRLHVNGHFSAIEIQLSLTRKYGFYLWKIMLLVWMIAIMSWSTFLIRDVTGRLDDTEIFVMRLEFTAALLLAAVSFLYISQESIPRLSYLTSLDLMLLFSFFNLFMVVMETVFVRAMSRRSKLTGSFFYNQQLNNENKSAHVDDFYYNTDSIIQVDTHALIIYPIVFHFVELIIPFVALMKRKKWVNKLVNSGLDGHVGYGLSCNTWEEEWNYMSKNDDVNDKKLIERTISGRTINDTRGNDESIDTQKSNLFYKGKRGDEKSNRKVLMNL